jgi:hypothetical protein
MADAGPTPGRVQRKKLRGRGPVNAARGHEHLRMMGMQRRKRRKMARRSQRSSQRRWQPMVLVTLRWLMGIVIERGE